LLFGGSAHAQTVVSTLGATGDVHDVAPLGEGRVAVATSGGLVIAGESIEHVLREGLPGARLRSVSVLGESIWVGAIEGLAEVRLEPAPRVVRTLPISRARRVVEWRGALWVATYGNGLLRIEGERASEVSIGRDETSRRLTDLVIHGEELWVATAGRGIIRLDARGLVLGRIRARDGLPNDLVWHLEPQGDAMWVGTLEGAARIVDGRIERGSDVARASARLSVRDVRAIDASNGGMLASWGGGVVQIEGTRSRRVGTIERAHAIAVTNGIVWVGGPTGLVRNGRMMLGGGLPSADITALVSTRDAIWIGTFDRGLARMRADGTIEAVSVAIERWGMDPRINDLATTRDGHVWIATDRGLFMHDGRLFAPIDDPNGPGLGHVTALHVDREGALWVASSRALARFADGRWTSWHGGPELPIAQLHAVTTDARDNVWVGSLHGLYRFDRTSGAFARESVASGALPVDWVTSVVPWRGGVMAGTYHGGLVWSTDGERFRIEREGETLASGWVNPHAITVHAGRAWVGTLEGGLLVGEPGAWSRIDTSTGLPSSDVTDILPIDDDEAWVATRGGLARVRM
jgi:ligand-binding sensor domain-containing protein